MVSINDVQLIGFVTSEVRQLPVINMPEDQVSVYLPMSYQLGGYTVYISKKI